VKVPQPPIITVIGKAFFDIGHAPADHSNRRTDLEVYAAWEIHGDETDRLVLVDERACQLAVFSGKLRLWSQSRLGMRYIRINPKSLEADIVASKDDKAIYVPIQRERSGSAFTDLLHYTVRFDVLYPMVETHDRKRGAQVSYSLHEADPWLVALAAIMWQGLVQGLTWDVIKHSCLSALDKLRQKRLAPPTGVTTKTQARRSRTEIGSSWTKFNEDGRPLYEFFLGVKRRFQKATKEERAQLTTAKHIIRKPLKRPKQAMERTEWRNRGR
jgi:hypothetical protein